MPLREILNRLNYSDSAQVQRQLVDQILRVRTRLAGIRRKLLVLSGKGGVGKSTVTASLALALARSGRRVGILDADINGSSIPGMLGLSGRRLELTAGGAVPPPGPHGIAVASMPFLADPAGPEAGPPGREARPPGPVRWKGPLDLTPTWLSMMESGVIREFLADVQWGELDALLVDLPPGAAADKPPVLIGLIPDLDGALVVATPSAVAVEVVRKSMLYARDLGIRLLGIVENMAELACPRCAASFPIFPSDSGLVAALADEMKVPLLARIPLDPELHRSLESGIPLAESHPIARLFAGLAKSLEGAAVSS